MTEEQPDETDTVRPQPTPVAGRPPAVSTGGDDPFAEDLLERRDTAQMLSQLLERTPGPFVLAIDAPWGMGKTTFLEMWRASLSQEGFACLSINAWETDFAQEPFTALMGELADFLASLTDEDAKTARVTLEKARAAGRQIARRALPTIAKVATAGLIDTDAIGKEMEDAISEVVGDLSGDVFEHFSREKEAIQDFRTQLESAVALVRESSEIPHAPLVVMIDELDRCRPPYALSLLERVKHLFDVEGVVFVLSIDKRQLVESVRATYGVGVDAPDYLRRFIDLDYRLPRPDAKKFAEAQIQQLGLINLLNTRIANPNFNPEGPKSDARFLIEFFPELCAVTRMTLRQILQATVRLGIALRTIPHGHMMQPVELALLVVLRECAREEYDRLGEQPLDFERTLAWFRQLPNGEEFLESNSGLLIEAALALGAENASPESGVLDGYKAKTNHAGTSEADKKHAQEVLHRVSAIEGRFGFSRGLQFAREHIELLEGFSLDYEPTSRKPQ